MQPRSVVDANDPRKFARWVRELEGASGVYRIVAGGRVLYVGSSVNGNLYGTLTRKVQKWARAQSVASPGHTFDRFDVKAAVEVTESDVARAMEQIWIEQYKPALNEKAAAELADSYEPPRPRRRSGHSALDQIDELLDEMFDPDNFVPYY